MICLKLTKWTATSPSFCCSFPVTSSKCENIRAANTLPQACSVLPSAWCCRMASNWRQSRQRVYAPTSCAPSSQCLMIRLGQKVQNAFWLRAATVGSDEVFDWKLFACPLFKGRTVVLHVVFWPAQDVLSKQFKGLRNIPEWHNHTNIDPSGFRGRPLHSHYDLCVPISPLGYTGRGYVQFCLDQTPCWDTFAPASWTTAQNPKSGEGFSLVLGLVLPSIPVDTLWCLTHRRSAQLMQISFVYITCIYIYIYTCIKHNSSNLIDTFSRAKTERLGKAKAPFNMESQTASRLEGLPRSDSGWASLTVHVTCHASKRRKWTMIDIPWNIYWTPMKHLWNSMK